VDNTICYLNTDLDINSADDLTALAAAFEAAGLFPLHVTRLDNGHWFATFETEQQHHEPETNIGAMLSVVESLPTLLRATWDGCTRREFNVGYDCGINPWEFNQGISTDLLRRLAAAGGSLRITLYPDREPVRA
jgi:hypothetical protein